MQSQILDRIVDEARADPAVLAVILFGSAARDQATAGSDLDVCLVLQPTATDPLEHRIRYLGRYDVDLQIFQSLPLPMRLLQIAVEAALDVCAMLVADLRLGVPGEEDDLFEKLEAAGVLSADLMARLRSMKGFRNVLVHEYARVNDEKVFAILHAGPADFETFTQQVLRMMKSVPGES